MRTDDAARPLAAACTNSDKSNYPDTTELAGLVNLAEIEAEIDQRVDAAHADRNSSPGKAMAAAERLLALGEAILMHWLSARGEVPTHAEKEGFRLLALHRQGARGEPSFNACRETCREIAYHYNLIAELANASPQIEPRDTGRLLLMMALVTRHLCHFVTGKLEEAWMGEFCCSSRPVRAAEG